MALINASIIEKVTKSIAKVLERERRNFSGWNLKNFWVCSCIEKKVFQENLQTWHTLLVRRSRMLEEEQWWRG